MKRNRVTLAVTVLAVGLFVLSGTTLSVVASDQEGQPPADKPAAVDPETLALQLTIRQLELDAMTAYLRAPSERERILTVLGDAMTEIRNITPMCDCRPPNVCCGCEGLKAGCSAPPCKICPPPPQR